MHEVAIVGAGELGGALAHVIARRDVARTVRLIDDKGRIAEGKALDIAQAAPVEGFATRLVGSTDTATAAGANVIALADRAGGGEWQGEEALQLVRRLTRSTQTAIILCVRGTRSSRAASCGCRGRGCWDRRPKRWRREHVRWLRLPRTRRRGTSPSRCWAYRRRTSSSRGKKGRSPASRSRACLTSRRAGGSPRRSSRCG